MLLESLYWLCIVIAVYPYLGYPIVAALLARFGGPPVDCSPGINLPVSIVVAAHNEASRIGSRVAELSRLAAAVHPRAEVVVVSDGSTDLTAQIVRSAALTNVRLIEFPVNQGKAMALNSGVAAARHDLVAFADVRQVWNETTLPRLLSRFSDPEVGAVSGDLRLRTMSGNLASVGLYWRLEKYLRVNESLWRSSIGVTGAVSAVRRKLFPTLPAGTVLDDVYWPMTVIFQGFRVVHEPAATADDQLPDEIGGEYQRKLRTLAGNFQLLSLLPSLLLPWKNPVWFQFISHKVLRLVTPWLLLASWGLSMALASQATYAFLCTAQTVLLITGILAWLLPPIRRIWPLGIVATIFALNFAAWYAFWIWLTGSTIRTWKKVAYAEVKSSMQSREELSSEPTGTKFDQAAVSRSSGNNHESWTSSHS